MYISDEVLDLFGLLLVLVVITAIVFGGYALLEQASCAAVTSDMGFEHRWSFLTGCQIEVEQGTWIPLASYRWLEDGAP